ncbi:hypothetical protein BC938DRAFT_482132 [Jimgerdemannia flammicorona]|uniref:Uncharacterized protein n=1 Tax=Jimgerdemannia flammicorona TaxID=994334 RepID=A0A433QEP6_9FUNG|nr:hypothetical protein BC938DRAFT_482132 [Jimgerdemannia flammicorona]
MKTQSLDMIKCFDEVKDGLRDLDKTSMNIKKTEKKIKVVQAITGVSRVATVIGAVLTAIACSAATYCSTRRVHSSDWLHCVLSNKIADILSTKLDSMNLEPRKPVWSVVLRLILARHVGVIRWCRSTSTRFPEGSCCLALRQNTGRH